MELCRRLLSESCHCLLETVDLLQRTLKLKKKEQKEKQEEEEEQEKKRGGEMRGGRVGGRQQC